MTKISSRSTFFYKRVFPVLWFGFIAYFIVQTVLDGAFEREPIFLVVPLAMIVVGFVLLRKLVWCLADEVLDGGEYLLVRFHGDEDRVALSNVMNVSASTNTNPPRITLRLAKPGKFGTEIAFSPKARFTLNPFAKSQVAEDLIVRVDNARTSRAT